jgi:hypothetical protein
MSMNPPLLSSLKELSEHIARVPSSGSVRLIRHAQALGRHPQVPAWWSDLYKASPEATVFVSPQWVQTWLDVYGRPFSGQWLRWTTTDGRTVGGVLVLWRTVWCKGVPLRTCTLNASGHTHGRSPETEFNQVLHLPEFAEAISADLAGYLQQQRWDRVQLSGYEQTPFFESLVGKLNCVELETEVKRAPYVDLDNLQHQSYENSLNSKARLQVRQSLSRYEQLRGALSIDEAQDEPSRRLYLSELAQLHNATWKERGMRGSFACDAFTRFHEQLLRALGTSGEIKLMRVRAAEQVIGYLYAFVHAGKAYLYQSGFHYEQDAKLRPGLASHALAVRLCAAQGLNEYNLMAGESQYKRTLARERRTVCWSTAYRNTLAARTFLAMRDAKRFFRPVQAPEETASMQA